jgi:thiol:disulfide interchange protein
MRSLLVALVLTGQVIPAGPYDPKRDADQDIKDAVVLAQKTGKRILLEVGGEWCGWCHIMHRYFDSHPALAAARDRHYITLKINFSPENENRAVLSRYPRIPGYPHLFVLESDGTLLHSQGTAELEEGQSYNFQRFMAFIEKWAPPQR